MKKIILMTMLAGGLLAYPGRASQEIYTAWSWICGELDTSNEILEPHSEGNLPVEVPANESIEFSVRKEKIPNGCEVVKWTYELNVDEFLHQAFARGAFRYVIDSNSPTYRYSWNDKGDIYLGVVIDYFPYTVRFDAAVPDSAYYGSTASITDKRYPDEFTLTKNGFGRTGYRFAGWTNADGMKFADGATVDGERLGVTTNRTVVLSAVWEPLDTPVRKGYVFAGWTESLVDGVRTVTTNWTPISTSVRLVADGKTNICTCAYGTPLLVEAPKAREGFRFTGWEPSGGFDTTVPTWGVSPELTELLFVGARLSNGEAGPVYIGNLSDMTNQTVTLTADWAPREYAVRYRLGDGAFENEQPATVEYGEILAVDDPVRRGYVFSGWAVATNGQTIAYTAGWTPITMTVSVVSEGKALSRSTLAYGATLEIPAPAARAGYRFAGWTASGPVDQTVPTWGVSPALTEKVLGGTRLANGESGSVYVGNLSTTDGAAVTLTAVWEERAYALVYVLGGGEFAKAQPESIARGETLTLDDPTRPGYVFDGWTSETKGYCFVYTARWIPVTTTVSTVSEGKELSKSTLAYDATLEISAPAARAGYRFAGWEASGPVDQTVPTWGVSPALTEKILAGTRLANGEKGSVYVGNLSRQSGVTVTLTAAWEPCATKVYVYTGVGDDPAPVDVEPGVVFEPEAPARRGYVFAGWTVEAEGSVRVYTAIWKPVTATLEIRRDADVPGATVTVAYGEPVEVPAPVRAGYRFAGWTWAGDADLTDPTWGVSPALTETLSVGSVLANGETGSVYVGNLSTSAGAAVTLTALWEPCETKVRVYTGAKDDPFETNVVAGASFEPRTPARAGYVFAGWTVEARGSARIYTADWRPVSTTVTVDVDGRKTTFAVLYDETREVVAPTKAGYVFAGWRVSGPVDRTHSTWGVAPVPNRCVADVDDLLRNGEKGPVYVGSLSTTDGAAVTLTATWTPLVCTVEFYDGTNRVETFEREAGARPVRVPTVVKVGWAFAGWAETIGGKVVYGPDDEIGDVTVEEGALKRLYAVWAAETVTLAYDLAEGEFAKDAKKPTSVAYGTPVEISAPIRSGLRFAGWTASGAYDQVNPTWGVSPRLNMTLGYGARIVNGEAGPVYVGNLSQQPGVTVTLTATWAPVEYGVRYVLGETGRFTGSYPTNARYGEDFTVPDPVRTGYEFKEWDPKPARADATSATFRSLTSEHGAVVTLTAAWTPIRTTVQLVVDSKTENRGVDYDTVLKVEAPTKTGYAFAGWKVSGAVDQTTARWGTSENPTETLSVDTVIANGASGSVYLVNPTPQNTRTVTLTAQWTPVSYYVDYDYAGGVNGVSTTTNVYGTSFFVPDPIRPGYTFLGWDSPGGIAGAKDGRTGYWFDSLASENGRVVRLTAQWEGVRYKVALDLAGGAITSSVATATCGESFRLVAPTREGYLFAGWTATGGLDVRGAKWGVSSNPSRAFDPDAVAANGTSGDVWFRDLSLTANAEVRLQAQWTPIRYFIDYAFDGGTPGAELVREAAYDENVLVSDPTKDGKVFAGWAYPVTNENDEVSWIKYVPRKVFDGARQFKNLAAEDGAVVTLTARWGDVTGYVDFNVSVAINNPDEGQYVTLGMPYEPVTTAPEWTAGEFGGYYTEPYGQGTMYWDASGHPTKETWDQPIATGEKFDVYPLKVGKPYHLRFFETETTNNVSFISVVCTNGAASAAMSIRPYATTRTVDGRRERQDGWEPFGDSCNVCLTNVYPFSTILTGVAQFALQTENQVMDFKPHWVVDESPEDDPESGDTFNYTIRFYGNGGVRSDGNTYEDKSVRGSSDGGVGLADYIDKFSRSGFDFLGWTLDPAGAGRLYTDETLKQSNVGYGRTLRLYAVWTPIAEEDDPSEDDPSDDPTPVASTNEIVFVQTGGGSDFATNGNGKTWFEVEQQYKQPLLFKDSWDKKFSGTFKLTVAAAGTISFDYDALSSDYIGQFTASSASTNLVLVGSGSAEIALAEGDALTWAFAEYARYDVGLLAAVSNITWTAKSSGDPKEEDDPEEEDDPVDPEAPMSIAVTYRLNDGTGPGTNVYDNVTREANGKVGALPSPEPWWDGAHQFIGWTTNACPYFPTTPGDGTYFVSSETALSTNDVTFYAAWRTGTVEVVFHDVGPDGTGTTNVVYRLGETFASRWPAFERNGFRFVGCYYDASVYGGGYVLGDDIATFKTTDLYARWEAVKPVPGADEVIVSWLLDDGATSVWKRASCKTNEAFGAVWPRDPWKHGFEFDGWVDERDGSVTASTIVSAAVTNLYVTWKGAAPSSEKETVVFYLDDGTEWARIVCVKGLRYEESAPWSDDPVRTGYVFDGWYSGSEKIESDATAGAVIPALYARWVEAAPVEPVPEYRTSESEVAVEFWMNDGSGQRWTTLYCKTGEVPTVAWPGDPTRETRADETNLWAFAGWYGTAVVVEGQPPFAADDVLTVANLYARWTNAGPVPGGEGSVPEAAPSEVAVDFWLNDGTGAKWTTLYCKTGEVPTVAWPGDPARAGFEFVRWRTEPDGGGEVGAGDVLDVTELFAEWTAAAPVRPDDPTGGEGGSSEVAVDFYLNDGTLARWATVYCKTGEVQEIAWPADPARATATNRWDFAGWFDAAEGGTDVTGTNVLERTRYFAHWDGPVVIPPVVEPDVGEDPSEVAVDFWLNDGTGAKWTTIYCKTGEVPTVAWPGEPTRETRADETNRWDFAGWYDTPAKTGGSPFTSNDVLTVANLYARWTNAGPVPGGAGSVPEAAPSEVAVDFWLNDGTLAKWTTVYCKTGEVPTVAWPGDPTRETRADETNLWVFAGWYDEAVPDDATEVTATEVTSDDVLTVTNLYARWTNAGSVPGGAGSVPEAGPFEVAVDFWLNDGTLAKWTTVYCKTGEVPTVAWPGDPTRETATRRRPFMGWYDEAVPDDATEVTATEVTSNDVLTVTNLYARWGAAETIVPEVDPTEDLPPSEVAVTFYLNDGTGTKWATVYCKTGAVITAATRWPGDPTREGFDFAGWRTETDGGDEVVSNAVLNVTAVYAGWTETKSEPTDDPDDPIVDPEPADPITVLFPSGETGAFEGAKSATYLGWLQDASSNVVAALQVKTAKVSRKDDFKSTITVTPVGGRKRTVRATVEAASAHPVDEYGIVYGHDGLSGVFEGYAVVAARVQTETTLPKGVWGFARDGATGRTLYSVAISTKNKAKVTALLPNGKKVTVSTTAVMGEKVFAVTAVSTKKNAEFAEVFLLDRASTPASAPVGDLVFDFETRPAARDDYFATVDGYCVRPTGVVVTATAKKWTAPKTVGSVKVDGKTGVPYVKVTKNKTPQNLGALKIKYTSSTGLVSGSFKLYYLNGKKLKYETVSFTGFVIDGELVATAVNKKTDESFIVSATK